MRWRKTGREGIEDRRGMPVGRTGAIGGGMGIVGLLLVLLFNSLGGGGGGINLDPGTGGLPGMPAAQQRDPNAPDPDAALVDFVAFVFEDVQNSWEETFTGADRRYQRTTLVLFEQGTTTGCGSASSAIGPFYCPADQKVYIDLSFFQELGRRLGAPGDFAQAYVIAHEVAHHVQKVVGTSDRVREAQQRDPDDANELSVALELQADCLAGVWAHSAFNDNLLEEGDLEEGLDAAAAVGDDRLQKQSGGSVNQETWTHGSSAQRVSWFRKGFDTGDPEECDTF